MHVRNARRTAERKARDLPATYMVFDLLRLDGRDLHALPLAERRELLGRPRPRRRLDLAGARDVRRRRRCCSTRPAQQGLEGIVSKRLASRYEPGAAHAALAEVPAPAPRARTSSAAGAPRPARPSRLGALLVGEPTADGLVYRGRVGSGIAGAAGARCCASCSTPLARADSPFADEVPRVDAAGTHWVEPVLVVDVEALGLSRSSGCASRRTVASAPISDPRT